VYFLELFGTHWYPQTLWWYPCAPSLPQVCIFDRFWESRGGLGAALGPCVGPLFASFRILSQWMFDSSAFVGSGLPFWRSDPLKWTSTDLVGCVGNIANSDVFRHVTPFCSNLRRSLPQRGPKISFGLPFGKVLAHLGDLLVCLGAVGSHIGVYC
jgi:hypothetical protein